MPHFSCHVDRSAIVFIVPPFVVIASTRSVIGGVSGFWLAGPLAWNLGDEAIETVPSESRRRSKRDG
jgi:hypothetical protein